MRNVTIKEPAIIFRIAKRYQDGMSAKALYESTRGVWKVGIRRESVIFAFAVADGIVREVFEVKKWHPAGTTKYYTRTHIDAPRRWEFTGKTADQKIRNKYIGGSVAHYFAPAAINPVFYINA